MKIKQSRKPNLVLITEAGQIGKMGLNSKGLGQLQNGLFTGVSRVGVPYYAILRKILNSENINEAVENIKNIVRASSGNYMLSDKYGAIIDVETSQTDYDILTPTNSVIVHTNHYISKKINVRDLALDILPDSLIRFDRAMQLLENKKGEIDIDIIKTILKDHFNFPYSICRHIGNDSNFKDSMRTIVSIIMDLNNLILWIAEGPPCENEYIKIKLNI